MPMDERTAYVGFHVTPSVKQALAKQARSDNQYVSKWLFLLLLRILKEQGHEVSEHE